MARRSAPSSRRNPLLSRQESAIAALAETCNARKFSGRRDRLLLKLIAATGWSIGFVVQIRLWQLTYFFEPLPDDHEVYPDRLGMAGKRPWRYARIGIYWDYSFDRLLPVPRSIYKILRGYAGSFTDHEERSDYLFPVIRKNGNVAHDRHLTVRDAHKILRQMKDRAACGFHHDWNTIRQAAVARLLIKNLSIQDIMVRTGYRDPRSVRDIAKMYGLTARSDPSFTPPSYVGVDFAASFTGTNFRWYPFELYDYEGLWPAAYQPRGR
ncbi:MAG: hypothetical protein ACK5LJ_06950 [Paracoccus sp. (in: a-proteobacteria)]